MTFPLFWPLACIEIPDNSKDANEPDTDPVVETDSPPDSDAVDSIDTARDSAVPQDTGLVRDRFVHVATPLDQEYTAQQGDSGYLRWLSQGIIPIYTNLNDGAANAQNGDTLLVAQWSYDDFGYFTNQPSTDCTDKQTVLTGRDLTIQAENGHTIIWPMCEPATWRDPFVTHMVFDGGSNIVMNGFDIYRNEASAVSVGGSSNVTFNNVTFSQIKLPTINGKSRFNPALEVNDSHVRLTESNFVNNVADEGAGLRAHDSRIEAVDLDLLNNGLAESPLDGPTQGGAVYLDHSDFRYTNGTVAGNVAEQGASFYVGEDSRLYIESAVTLADAYVPGTSAQIYLGERGATVTIEPASGEPWTVDVEVDTDLDGVVDTTETVVTDPAMTTTCTYELGCI